MPERQGMSKKEDNRFIDWVCDDQRLSPGQRKLLHERITGQRMSKREILEEAREVRELYPNK